MATPTDPSTAPGTVLITGASSGIGRELARLFAERKHPLVLVGRNAARLEELASSLRTEHGVATWILSIDLATPGAARQVFDFTAREGIVVEYLVNNAGIGLYDEHVTIELDRLESMLHLNILALCGLCRLYGEQMKERRTGRILNVASTAAYQPAPYFAAYAASKAFVLNFSEALAMELSDHGVTVSCLSPGPTDTAFFGEIDGSGVHNAYLAKSGRHDPKAVAEIGMNLLMNGKLSKVVGAKNALRAWMVRFAPRKTVARMGKTVMRPSSPR